MNGAPVSESEKNLSIMSITKSVHHVHHKICPSVIHKTTPHGSGLLIKDFLSKTMLKESISLRKNCFLKLYKPFRPASGLSSKCILDKAVEHMT